MNMSKRQGAVIGAYVADAATLGLHWLYDQTRIAELEPSGLAFRTPDVRDYAGKPVFVHAGKRAGDSSHYGAQMLAMSVSLARLDRFDAADYGAAFRAAFERGGSWQGYIDRPTRTTLDAMAVEGADLARCGADDDQMPALAKLPPLIARHHGDPDLPAMVEAAVRVTNDRDDAVAWGQNFAVLLSAALEGAGSAEAVDAALSAAPEDIAAQITAAKDMASDTTADIANAFALHCHLPMAYPVLIHAILTAESFEAGVLANIRAGGDNCGRSLPIGAVLGAVHAGEIPRDWLARMVIPGAVLAV